MNTSSSFFQTGSSRRTMAVSGVMLVIFLFAIDSTIVSTSMPTIVAKLGGLELYSWVFSIYMLTSALTTPLFGKLSDLFSRRRLMLTGIGIFVLGSTLCGAARSMEWLVFFRAIQGLGGGAIYALAFIIVGVLFPTEQRARMQGVISSIWGISSILGPLAGGIIVEHWSWRWVFFVNLPISAAASALIILGMKEDRAERHAPDLDLTGAAALLLCLLLLFYALADSAHARDPANLETAGLLTAALLLLAIFLLIERRAREPIIPLDLFHVSLFRTSALVATLASMGVFGAISYFPLYLQGVTGTTASRAGMNLLVLSLGWTAGSLLAGQTINRFGYRHVSVAGLFFMSLGFAVFIFHPEPVSVTAALISGLFIGTGMGMANLTTLVAAQTSVWRERIGVATSTVMLFRTFGGAFSVSLMGTVLLSQMQRGLNQIGTAGDHSIPAALRDKLDNPQNLLEPATRAQIPPEWLPKLIMILGNAMWYAFFTAFILMLVGLAVSFFMVNCTPPNTPKPKERRPE